MISAYGQITSVLYTMLNEFSVSVYSIKGLASMFQSKNSRVLTDRLKAVDTVKSVMNAVLTDADKENYEKRKW